MFNLYDDDEFGSVHSEADGGIGTAISDALDHHEQL